MKTVLIAERVSEMKSIRFSFPNERWQQRVNTPRLGAGQYARSAFLPAVAIPFIPITNNFIVRSFLRTDAVQILWAAAVAVGERVL